MVVPGPDANQPAPATGNKPVAFWVGQTNARQHLQHLTTRHADQARPVPVRVARGRVLAALCGTCCPSTSPAPYSLFHLHLPRGNRTLPPRGRVDTSAFPGTVRPRLSRPTPTSERETTVTPIDRPVIQVNSPAELLALVPYLLGFQPSSSLVVLALAGSRMLTAARIDLPTCTAAMPQLRTTLDNLAATMTTAGATQAILAGYGSAAQVNPAIQIASATLHAARLPVTEALRVAEDRFYSLACVDPHCCPPGGTQFDPSTSSTAAAATAAGLVALPSQDDLTTLLEPVTGPAREAMETATIAAAQCLVARFEAAAPDTDDPDTSPNTPLGRDLLRTGRAYLTQAQQHYQAGRPLSDEQTAFLTLLLELPSVRQVAAGNTTGAPWQIQMWADLLRRAQPDLSAAPATLLALAALHAGNGPQANLAIQRALCADPADGLTRLLAQAITAGVDPATATTLLAS